MNYLYIIAFFIFVIIMIYFLPLTIKIKFNSIGKNFIFDIYVYVLYFFKIGLYNMYYKSVDENDRLEIVIKTLFGIKLFNLVIDVANLTMKDKKPVIEYNIHRKSLFKIIHKKNNNKVFSFHDIKRILHTMYINKDNFYNTYINFLRTITFRKLNVEITEGFNDAALTSIFYGLINGILYPVVTHIYYNTKFLARPQISIKPYYGKTVLESSFDCILDFRYGNIIINGIKLIKNFKWR
ncbi:DUF2953 domain-containing protein [Thermoanaerobacterium sp. RBIITD]|uniref:DUF2953 domain-containing protein n=1 Tax=Thermoanaerobacterium sp. RBIITD TaxID=1550240 RepID=UPI000BBF8B95|nr:DUF2953 domain-containing protein [Thermoanaerobacterium sp. RBIITD]SNX55401.1 Protein of unknown function [Thermoanaerobacterium sp. RBIITD]